MKWLVIIILIVSFVLDLWLSFLNYRYRKKELPPNALNIYEPNNYKKMLEYTMEKFSLNLIKRTVLFLFIMFLLIFDVFANLHEWTTKISTNELHQLLLFLGIYFTLSTVISLFFSYYNVLRIEEKYGFNKQTKKGFFFDQVKSKILMILGFGGLFIGAYFTHQQFMDSLGYFTLFVWALVTVVMLLINVLSTKVFMKIFYKFSPLEDVELKDMIEQFGEKTHFHIRKVSIMHHIREASKKSTKLNAFFTGLGKTKEIVLFDTLVEKLSKNEIIAVLAHEAGHAKHQDIPKMMMRNLIQFGLILGLFTIVLSFNIFYIPFGFSQLHFAFALILFFILMDPFMYIISLLMNYFSRRAEFKADAYAALNTSVIDMKNALIVLTRENFSVIQPHPLYEAIHYSHPSISKRLHTLSKLNDCGSK